VFLNLPGFVGVLVVAVVRSGNSLLSTRRRPRKPWRAKLEIN
jgi:hypothetical protein